MDIAAADGQPHGNNGGNSYCRRYKRGNPSPKTKKQLENELNRQRSFFVGGPAPGHATQHMQVPTTGTGRDARTVDGGVGVGRTCTRFEFENRNQIAIVVFLCVSSASAIWRFPRAQAAGTVKLRIATGNYTVKSSCSATSYRYFKATHRGAHFIFF
jgi:hypothetical protein